MSGLLLQNTSFREPVRQLSQEQVDEMNLRYYNSSIHRAAFVLPEFTRKVRRSIRFCIFLLTNLIWNKITRDVKCADWDVIAFVACRAERWWWIWDVYTDLNLLCHPHPCSSQERPEVFYWHIQPPCFIVQGHLKRQSTLSIEDIVTLSVKGVTWHTDTLSMHLHCSRHQIPDITCLKSLWYYSHHRVTVL